MSTLQIYLLIFDIVLLLIEFSALFGALTGHMVRWTDLQIGASLKRQLLSIYKEDIAGPKEM